MNATNSTFADIAVWSSQAQATAGLAAATISPAATTFQTLLLTNTTSAFSVSRVYTFATPAVGTVTRFYRFSIRSTVTDDVFLNQAAILDGLYRKEVGYLQLIMMKSVSTQTWGMLLKWTTAAALATALDRTSVNATGFWQTIDPATQTQTDFTLTRSFVPTLGTPMTYVVLHSFFLKEGEDSDAFLTALANAETPLRIEVGYLGRNVMWARDGRFSLQWWWASKSNQESSQSRLTSYQFAASINTTTETRSFFFTKASFQPWDWDRITPCGEPIYIRQYNLADSMNETQYLANIQTAEDDFRTSGLLEWNVLQDASNPAAFLDVGWQWQNYSVYLNAQSRLSQIPVARAVLTATNSSSEKLTSFYYIKGFWPWTDTSYSCYKRLSVDPAVSGASWTDNTLRRTPPMHQVSFPPPGIMPNGKLLVFLPNFGRAPSDYRNILDQAADLGYLAVGLTWLNGIEIRRLCVGDSVCFKGCWDGLLFGATDTSPSLVGDVEAVDSVTVRLLGLLQYLNATAPWTTAQNFYSAGALRYDRMVWAGAGIGASAVFSLAQSRLVDRAIAIDGPVDQYQTGNAWLDQPAVTPKTRWFSVMSQRNPRCPDMQWNALKANVSSANTACLVQAAAGAIDTAVTQGWTSFNFIKEVWQYTLSQCGSSGLTSAQIANITRNRPFYCDGTGEVYIYGTHPEVYASGVCQNCNQSDSPMVSVSAFGYDRGQCTETNPCRTIQYAVNQAVPNSQINIQRGTYEENVVIPVDKTGLTLVGSVDKDGNPESIIQCGRLATGGDNVCLTVFAPRVTVMLLSIAHVAGLPVAREVGISFMASANESVVQKTRFTRVGVTDVAVGGGSRGIEVLGATDVGIFDNSFKGTYQQGISVAGSRTAVLRNTVWGQNNMTIAGIVLLRGTGAVNSTVVGNRVRGINGDGIQIQSNGNLLQKNKVWRNYGTAIRICGPGTTCLAPFSGTCAASTILRENRLGLNQGGWIMDSGCNTSLTCHSRQSVHLPASCTPRMMYVNSAAGNDTSCTFNDPTKKCKTIAGALARSMMRYWIILEDGAYTESVTLNLEGLVLRGNQLGQYTILNAPLASGTIVTVNALEVFLEALDLRHNNATTSAREIAVYVTSSGLMSTVEDCRVTRQASNEPMSPGSRGILVEGPQATVAETTFRGTYQNQLTVAAPKATIWLNTVEQAGQIAILLMQNTPPANTTGTTVRENVILGAGLDGIQIQGDGNLVEYNQISSAKRVGIHLCAYSNQTGAGGACSWISFSSPQFPEANIVKDNRAIRSPINFVDDLNTTANSFVFQLPQYEPLGILDPQATQTSQWVTVSPSKAIVGGVVPLRVIGFWARGYRLQVKLAAGRDGCYGDVPVMAGGTSWAPITEAWAPPADAATPVVTARNTGTVGPLSTRGEYRVCIRHRQDWEPTDNIVTVTASDSKLVYAGAPNCQAALQADGTGGCGCWFRRGAPSDTFFMPMDLPLSLMTSGESDVAINQGCCVRNTPIRTGPLWLNPTTAWGLCSDRATY